MKKEYLKPQAIIVDIELYNSVLDEDPAIPTSEGNSGNSGVWDDTYDRLPTNKSVWDDKDGSVEAEEQF